MRLYLFCVCTVLISCGYAIPDANSFLREYRGKRYDGHQLLRVYPRFTRDAQILESLKNNQDLKADFWHDPLRPSPYVDVLLDPKHKGVFHTFLKGHSIKYVVSHPNFQDAIDGQFFEPEGEREEDLAEIYDGLNLNKYHNFDQIVSWLFRLEEKHKDCLSVIQIGNTVEGRPIYTVKISHNDKKRKQKPAIWLDAGIHSNEWVGPATLLHFIHKFLKGYESDPAVTVILDTFDWYITPIINVDGFTYTWTKDRLWRKNRSTNEGTECVGVDLNRNWGTHWGETRTAARDPCDRMYIGRSAMSEPEVKAVGEFLRRQNGTVLAYLAYHSFGQLWMTPYSYSKTAPLPDQQLLLNMSQEAVAALEKVHHTKYRVGRISELVGEASGASVDYTYQALNIKYSFGIELRDDGRYGTLLPPNQIKPNAEESFEAIKKLATVIYEKLN